MLQICQQGRSAIPNRLCSKFSYFLHSNKLGIARTEGGFKEEASKGKTCYTMMEALLNKLFEKKFLEMFSLK